MKLILKSSSDEALPSYADVVSHSTRPPDEAQGQGQGQGQGQSQSQSSMFAAHLNAGSCRITVVSPSQENGGMMIAQFFSIPKFGTYAVSHFGLWARFIFGCQVTAENEIEFLPLSLE